jgi:hypothetical protein
MFDGSVDFAAEIEKRTKTKNSSYIDAVMEICEQFEIEPAAIARYLTKPMIAKIKAEADTRHFRLPGKPKGKSTQLPL